MNALTEGFTNPLRRMLGRLCECVPFSVSEGLYVLAALGFLAFLVLGVRAVVRRSSVRWRSRRRSGTKRPIWRLRRWACLGARYTF